MNSKRSHKIFALVMLIMIVASVVATAALSIYNVYDYKHQQQLKEDALAAIDAVSETASEAA